MKKLQRRSDDVIAEQGGRSRARRDVSVRGGSLRGLGCIRVRGELSLLGMPSGDRLGLQGVCRYRAGELTITDGFDDIAVFGEEDLNDTRCGACGSFLFSVLREGAFVHVSMGSLVDAPTIRPTSHIFVGSKAAWFEITDDLPQFDEYAM